MSFVHLKGLLLKALPQSLQHGRLRSLQMVVNQNVDRVNGVALKNALAMLKNLRPNKRPKKATLMVTVVSSLGLAGYGFRNSSSSLGATDTTFHR